MKIIDEKGRLFNKINIIDLFVVIMIGILAVSFMVNFPNTIKGRHKPASEEMYVTVLFTNVSNRVLENKKVLRRGDTFLSGNATVERILKTDPASTADIFDLNNKRVGYSQANSFSNIVVLIRANCVKLYEEYYCANVLMKINSQLTLSNELYLLQNGIILDVSTKYDHAS